MIVPTAETMEMLFECPGWCVRDHVDESLMPYHAGPRVGGVGPTWTIVDTVSTEGREWVGDVNLLHYNPKEGFESGLTVSELRQLAADALAAADWIEAHA